MYSQEQPPKHQYPYKVLKVLNDKTMVFDGINGTVAHLKDIIIKNNTKNLSKEKGHVEIQSSLKGEKTLELYNKLLYGGIL